MNELTDLDILMLNDVRNTQGIEAAEQLVTAILMVRDARESYMSKLADTQVKGNG